MKNIPEYNPKARCPKCGHDQVGTVWQSELDCVAMLTSENRCPCEHLKRVCFRCHYAWAERCCESTVYCAARDIPADTVLQPADVTPAPPDAPRAIPAVVGAKKWSNWINLQRLCADEKEVEKSLADMEENPRLFFSIVGGVLLFKFAPAPEGLGDTTIYRCQILEKKVLIDHAAEELADKEAESDK